MPTYDYYCPENDCYVEVIHRIGDTPRTWGELCRMAGIDPRDTPETCPVKKVITAPNLNFPKTNTELKNMGFTKLVRREKGVYENVTAREGDKRYMKADDPSSVPNFSKTIGD